LKKIVLGTIFTSRGCPFNCTYCSSSLLFGKKFRARSPKNIVDEIEQFCNTYKSKDIEILDDLFIMDKKRTVAICQEITDRKLDLRWVCSARVDIITKELTETLKKAGCTMIYFGIESGCQRVLNLMRKGTKVQQAAQAIKWAKEVGVESLGSYVIGIPGETVEDMEQTIKFAKELDTGYTQFAIATPYPGTELYRVAKEQGLLLTENWSDYTVVKPIIATKDFSVKDIKRLIKKAYVTYYLRPKIIYRYIKKGHFKAVMGKVITNYISSRIKFKFANHEMKGYYIEQK
ncbi:MAG: radical SAM protein, partial [Candidatus Bathyarchaeota archaeon]